MLKLLAYASIDTMTKVLNKLLLFCFIGMFHFISSTSYGQDIRKELYEANQLMEERLFNKALVILQKLHSDVPDNSNVSYKLGLCFLNSREDRALALTPLRDAVVGIKKNYDPFVLTETGCPVVTRFHLAEAYHLNYEMDSAIIEYNKFLDEAPKKHFLRPEAERQIQICETAKLRVAQPLKEIEIVNIGGVVNGEYPDFSPVISIDENALFFTSRRLRADTSPEMTNKNYRDDFDGQHFEDIYVSYRDLEGNWQDPELLNFSTRTRHEATINVTPDGQLLFIYIDDAGDGNIYTSQLIGDTWTQPEKLPDDINTKAWETHATMSADGKTMFFVSDRKGGQGGRDIYRVVRLPNGEWSKALNIGAPINTEYDEDAPYLHPDGKTMYFASKGHTTMGGFDIFKTIMNEDGTWTDPINIGYPINTVDDDVFFVTSADGKRGYFSSVRSDGYGEKDIYVIHFKDPTTQCLAVVKGRITPADGMQIPDDLMIHVSNLETGENTSYRPRQRDGGFVMIVDPCNTYAFDIVINDSSYYSEDIAIPCDACYFEVDKALNLNNLVIEGDSVYVLTPRETESDTPIINSLANTIHWELRYADTHKAVDKNARVAYMNKEGNISFVEEVGAAGEFRYHEIPGITEYYFGVQLEDPELCRDFEVVLIGADGKGIAETEYTSDCVFVYKTDDVVVNPGGDIVAVPCDYKRYFKYNYKDIKENERRWKEFVDCVANMIEIDGGADVYIEGSASFVVTETWKTNENLSSKRASTARQQLIDALKRKKVDASKLNFVELKNVVQGPPYSPTNVRPIAEYEQFQYVQIYATKKGVKPAGWVAGSGTFPQDGGQNGGGTANNNPDCGEDIKPYQRFYTYNNEGIEDVERLWNEFVSKLEKKVKECGTVNIDIEGSASYVTTETWKTNDRLCKQRANAAKDKLIQSMKARGVDQSKLNFVRVKGVVQGPPYKSDGKIHISRMKEYEPFQYVKIEVQ